MEHTGQPTVILAKTIKGYGARARHFAGRNATHQMKKLTPGRPQAVPRRAAHPDHRRAARGRTPTCRRTTTPARTGPAIQYLLERRAALGGCNVPSAAGQHAAQAARRRGLRGAASSKKGSGKQEIATTMAFVRLLKDLMRDKEFGPRVVPDHPGRGAHLRDGLVLPDVHQDLQPARAELHLGRRRTLMLAYRESEKGQILHEGINEAGSVAAFTAAGTSYATHGRADGADLRLLLDVRVPADRRTRSGPRPTR